MLSDVLCVSLYQQSLEKNPLEGIPSSASPHDVAALLRQYLRELPDLLLTDSLSPVFVGAAAVREKKERSKCVLLTTLLLPTQHLLCTQVSNTATPSHLCSPVRVELWLDETKYYPDSSAECVCGWPGRNTCTVQCTLNHNIHATGRV